MNYFDYFTEIEDEFVRRRGSHLMVSTLDWSLMETWKQRGIPLHLVLRAINQTFDQYDKRNHRGRKVNTLFFCRQAVEENFFNYLESRVGNAESGDSGQLTSQPPVASLAPDGTSSDSAEPFSQSGIITHLREKADEFTELAATAATTPLGETLLNAVNRLNGIRQDLEMARTISAELLEQDLTLIEESILTTLIESTPSETLAAMKTAGKKLLRGYRETMPPEIYRQTLDNFIARELRRDYRIPRLSLFYIKQ